MYYDIHIFCCTNKRDADHPRGCCSDKGSEGLRDYMKDRCKELGFAKTRVNSSGCLDRCELGPCMVIYPEGTWYHYRTKEDIDNILTEHIQGKREVKSLKLRDEQKRL